MKMKSNISLKTVAVLTSLIACITTTQASAETPSALSDEFKSGSLKLEYSVFGKGYTGAEDLKRMYEEKKWEELVNSVVSKRFVINTYYFYLGAAAEGLGYPVAAYKYFELAAKTPEKCADYQTWTDTCVGFKFPNDAVTRMAGLSGAMGEEQNWLPGEGPRVFDLVGLVPTPIEDLLQPKPERSTVRDKFETDDEYKSRVEKIKKGFLAVAPLNAKSSYNCQTSYDHAAGEYKISACLALVGGVPLRGKHSELSPIRLSNAITSRDIKRDVSEDYYYAGSYVWNQAIKVSRDEAKTLENELVVGIFSDDFLVTRKCLYCESTRTKDAFLKGSMTDTWMVTVRPTKVQRIVVYRQSDSRVLYSFTPKS